MKELIVRSFVLGLGLAMDAFSVSVATGLSEPSMPKKRMLSIAGVFGSFQFAMPLIGWICVSTLVRRFTDLAGFIPWIALFLLLAIGIKMIAEGLRGAEEPKESTMGRARLVLLGIATSIDALSVGFAISQYNTFQAILCSVIIGVLTFAICMGGLFFGRKLGTRFAGKAPIFGGIVLIIIGIEIFVKGVILV